MLKYVLVVVKVTNLYIFKNVSAIIRRPIVIKIRAIVSVQQKAYQVHIAINVNRNILAIQQIIIPATVSDTGCIILLC